MSWLLRDTSACLASSSLLLITALAVGASPARSGAPDSPPPPPIRGVPGFVDIGAPLTGVRFSTAAWGDTDNDGDLDLFITGRNAAEVNVAKLYRNDGGGSFVDFPTSMTGVSSTTPSNAILGDYDNDNDLDVLLTGAENAIVTLSTSLYRNDGNNFFVEIPTTLPDLAASSLDWGDYDNDGDQDLLLTGQEDGFNFEAQVLRNDGNASFTNIGAALTDVWVSSVAWGDADNDGDLDFVLTGQQETTFAHVAKYYRNDCNDSFSEVAVGLAGVRWGDTAWGDSDNDGDLDLLLIGQSQSGTHISKLYRNDGNDSFVDLATGFDGVDNGAAAWGDYDNDGDLDLLLSGRLESEVITTKLYRNDGGNVFADISVPFPGLWYSGLSPGGTGTTTETSTSPCAGRDGASNRFAAIYRNDGVPPELRPVRRRWV